MVKEQELECNIAAAELLGYEYIVHDKLASGSISIRIHSNTTRLFNLFTNPADCLAVVKKFGCIPIHIASFVDSINGLTRWFWDDHEDGSSIHYETYEEAVGAACLEIKGGRVE